MRKRTYGVAAVILSLVLVLALALMLGGCGEKEEEAADTTPAKTTYSGVVKASGSTTVLPLAQEAVTRFTTENPGATVEVQGGGSSTGIEQVKEGVVDIGNSSRDLKDEENDGSLVDHKIALDIISVIVNPSVPVTSLTTDQVKGIFTGAITNWNEVGGPDARIVVVVRDKASGTREMFDEKALGSKKDAPVESVASAIETNSNGIMRETVSSTANSIGYISHGYLTSAIKGVQYDGVEATLENATNGTYPLSRYLHMITKGEPSGVVKAYIDYVLSDDFQEEVVAEEYIPIKEAEGQQ